MRELFEEASGLSPLDPQELVRRAVRAPRRKRFYAKAGAVETSGGFAVTLDDKPIRTPSARQVVVPAKEIADAIVAEWDAQKEFIDPLTMPMTRFANSVVDAVVDRVEAVTEDMAKYFETDLLFYRAGHPEALVARETAHWDPLLFWAAAHVDEDWNIEKWGVDEEVAARRAGRLVDFRAAARILKAMNPDAGSAKV